MTIQDYINSNPYFFEEENRLSEVWGRVSKQARRHSSRDSRRDLFATARPGEAEEIRSYREQNDRLITKEGVDKFVSLSVRIFKNSHIDLSGESLNDEVKAYLESKPFYILTQKVGILDFFFTSLYRYSIDDPNAVWVPFPVSRNKPGQAPVRDTDEAGQPLLSTPIRIESRVIPSKSIITKDHIFSFEGETVYVEIATSQVVQGRTVNGSKTVPKPVYYIADDQDWVQYYPIPNPTRGESPEIIYEIRPWYPHATGEIPVVQLPGTLSFIQGEDHDDTYMESILHSMFEYADEVTQRFSDHQGIVLKHSHPKIIMSEQQCSTCGGKGTTTVLDAKGNILRNDEGTVLKSCGSCGGAGIIKDAGPFQTLYFKVNKNKTGSIESTQSYDDVYKEIAPQSDAIKTGHEIIFDLWNKAKQTVGLDVLSLINESGKAHEIRLEIVQDKLGDVAEQITNSVQKYLEYVTALLVPDENQRQTPKVVKPKSLSVKPAELLLKSAQDSPECARFDAYMEYYNARFRNDPSKIRVYELAMGYSPLVCMDDAEIEIRTASGAYNQNDIIKADRAVWAFTQLQSEKQFLDPDATNEMYDKADALISPYLVTIEPIQEPV